MDGPPQPQPDSDPLVRAPRPRAGLRPRHHSPGIVDPRLIYASRRTGFLVAEGNLGHLPEGALEEWNTTLDEYDERMKSEPS